MTHAQFKIEWTPRARQRFRARQDWIATESCSIETAIDWANKIRDAIPQISDFPRIGRVVPEINRDAIREIIVAGTTRVIYKVGKGKCSILSVRRTREQITSLRSL